MRPGTPAHDKSDKMDSPLISVLTSFLCGGVCGAFINASVTRNLEKRKRRREFHGFLEQWKKEVQIAGDDAVAIHAVYFDKVSLFRREVAIVRDSFHGKQLAGFDDFSRRLSGLMKDDLNRYENPKQFILGRIND